MLIKRKIVDHGTKIILDILHNSNYLAYVVGGCVRNGILNVDIADIDICTDALPSQVVALFSEYTVVPIGLNLGTVTIKINNIAYEITTFRKEGTYEHNRAPKSVEFITELEQDLVRRDFTMNAIAYNGKAKLIDLFGGVSDIRRKIIRAIGDPDIKFKEDALRILRAVRFASILGFNIEENTKQAIFNNLNLLDNISVERKFIELKKILMGKSCYKVLVEYKEVIFKIIPELKESDGFAQNSKWHSFDVYTHIIKSVKLASQDIIVKLTMLLHDIGKPRCYTYDNFSGHFYGHAQISAQMSEEILTNLKVDRKTKRDIVNLVEYHDYRILNNVKEVKVLLNILGDITFFKLLDVKKADNLSKTRELSSQYYKMLNDIRNTATQIINNGQCYNLRMLAINGKDLIDLEIEEKQISVVLKDVLNLVINEELENDKDTLIEYVVKKYKDK